MSKLNGFNGYNFTEICDYVGVGEAKIEGSVLTIGGQTSVVLK
jgi:hypothetical protein